jgi:hypothetical protein
MGLYMGYTQAICATLTYIHIYCNTLRSLDYRRNDVQDWSIKKLTHKAPRSHN